MFDIDVHIIRSGNENPQWTKECLMSIKDEPINIHFVPHIEGDIKAARFNGFLQGTAKYVSFIDLDDIVIPGVFSVLKEELDNFPEGCGVYSLSEYTSSSGNSLDLIHPFRPWNAENLRKCLCEVHQVELMRREDVIAAFESPVDMPTGTLFQLFLSTLMGTYKPWKAVNFVGYKWRVHKGGVHNTKIPIDEKNKILEDINILRNIIDSTTGGKYV